LESFDITVAKEGIAFGWGVSSQLVFFTIILRLLVALLIKVSVGRA
jgi:hypothetical protein